MNQHPQEVLFGRTTRRIRLGLRVLFLVVSLTTFVTPVLHAQSRALIGSLDPRFFPTTPVYVNGIEFDGQGQLIVAGDFQSFERSEARGLAIETSGGWRAVSTDVAIGRHLASDPDGNIYALVREGYFEDAESFIGIWDGMRWSRVAPPPRYGVRELAAGKDGAVYITSWLGSHWGSYGDGLMVWRSGAWNRLPDTPEVVEDLVRDPHGMIYARWGTAIHRWDPGAEVWSEIPPPPDWQIGEQFMVGGGGEVYARLFPTEFDPENRRAAVGRWSGSEWELLGQPLTEDQIYSIHLADGVLYRVEGPHDTAALRHLTRWDGSSWNRVPESPGTRILGISRIASHGSRLVALGQFELDSLPHEVIQFDDHSWRPITDAGLQLRGESPSFASGPGGEVYAFGSLIQAGSTPIDRLARWNGAGWENVDVPPGANSFKIDPHGTLLYTGHFGWSVTDHGFEHDDGPYTNIVALQDGEWEQFPMFPCEDDAALPVDVQRMTFHSPTGTTYAAGICRHRRWEAGQQVVGRWNGVAWTTIARTPDKNRILSMAVTSGGDLYVGGEFAEIDGTPARGVARWDGSQWHAIGEGLHSAYTQLSGLAHVILPWRDHVVISGAFEHAGGMPVASIAAIAEGQWESLSSPFYSGHVYSMAVGKDGLLYAAGLGSSWDDAFVARYDGSRWERVVEGFQNPPRLAFDGEGGLLMEDWTTGTERWLPEGLSKSIVEGRSGLYSFQVFPQPTTDRASIRLRPSSSGNLKVTLFDAIGRKLQELRTDARESEQVQFDIDLSPYPAGIYFLRVTTPAGTSAQTIVRI